MNERKFCNCIIKYFIKKSNCIYWARKAISPLIKSFPINKWKQLAEIASSEAFLYYYNTKS